MSRRIFVVCMAFAALASLGTGCGQDDKKKSESTDVIDVLADGQEKPSGDAVDAGEDVVPGAVYFPPPKVILRQFTVVAETNSTMGVEGQEFVLSARVARGFPDGDVAFAWELDGGKAKRAGGEAKAELTISFPAAGNHAVGVTATDGSGNTAEAGVLIAVVGQKEGSTIGDVSGDGVVDETDVALAAGHVAGESELTASQFVRADLDLNGRLTLFDLELLEPAIGAAAPEVVWPEAGAPGAMIRMIHPALLDAEVVATIQLAGAQPLVPIRMRPGYAAFVVPPELAANPSGAVELLVAGEASATFAFEVLAVPAASGKAGEKLEAALDDAEQLLAMAAPLFDTYCTAMDAPPAQRAALLGMVQVATDSFAVNREALADAFGQMDDVGRGAFEQVARANGLDGLSAEMTELKGRLQQTSGSLPLFIDPAAAGSLIDVLCIVQDVNSAVGDMVQVTGIAANYLGWFDWWPATDSPEVTQVIQFMTDQSALLGVLTSLLGAAAQYLPELGEVSLNIGESTLLPGESTTVGAAVGLVVTSGVCAQGGGVTLGALLEDQLAYSLGGAIPLVGQAFETADFLRENMDAVSGLVYDVASALFGEVLGAAEVDEALAALPDLACGASGSASLPLDVGKVSVDCSAMESGSWKCTEGCSGAVHFEAEIVLCGGKQIVSALVMCGECGPGNCGGCCQMGLCIEETGDAQCGANGADCEVCPQFFQCAEGECSCTSECAQVGEKSCQGDVVFVCAEVATDPPCNKLQMSEPCEPGSKCVEGECVEACGPDNCAGCCMADQTCMPGIMGEFCGLFGVACEDCGGSPNECLEGICVCEQTCGNLGWECGTDGCGNDCGACTGDESCVAGQCVGDELTAIITVEEGNVVLPLTTLHLSGEDSVAPIAPIIEWKWEVEQPPGATGKFSPGPGFPKPTFMVQLAGAYTFQLSVGDKSDAWSEVATYEVTVTPGKAIHVELVWDTPGDPDQTDSGPMAGADLDIHFIHPMADELDLDEDGQLDGYFDQPYDCFWFNPHPNWGVVDPEVGDNPSLDIDDTDGAGPEVVSLAVPEAVAYKVGAHYWNDHGFGPSFATVRVYVSGMLVFEMADTELAMKDMWEACTIEWPSGTVTAITDGNGLPKVVPDYIHPFFQ